MRKILWYAFLLIPAVFTSCNLEDDSGLIPQENRKLTISFSVQDIQRLERTDLCIRLSLGDEYRYCIRLFGYRTKNDRCL